MGTWTANWLSHIPALVKLTQIENLVVLQVTELHLDRYLVSFSK